MSWNNWCPDCIHLHACRRMTRLIKKSGKCIPRGCNDNCTAYVSGQTGEYVSVEEAVDYAIDGVGSIRSGYDPLDVYYTGDLRAKTLGELIDKADKETHQRSGSQ